MTKQKKLKYWQIGAIIGLIIAIVWTQTKITVETAWQVPELNIIVIVLVLLGALIGWYIENR